MTEIPPAKGPSESNPPFRERSRANYPKALWVSLGISALLHLFVILLYPSLLVRAPSFFSPVYGPSAEALGPEGTRLVNLLELPEPPDPEVIPPEEEPEPEVPELPVQEERPGEEENPGGVQEGPPTGPTAAERLRPRAGDLRLWAPVDPEIIALSEEEIMRLLLSAELEGVADSMALAEEMARRGLDWTYTDDEGKRWGISPGVLHLGDVTLPLPSFGASPWNREQNADRLWAWDDIERGAARKGVQDVWRERAEAIRRRRDAERKPDTTGIRR
jgi:hypothetical protein